MYHAVFPILLQLTIVFSYICLIINKSTMTQCPGTIETLILYETHSESNENVLNILQQIHLYI